MWYFTFIVNFMPKIHWYSFMMSLIHIDNLIKLAIHSPFPFIQPCFSQRGQFDHYIIQYILYSLFACSTKHIFLSLKLQNRPLPCRSEDNLSIKHCYYTLYLTYHWQLPGWIRYRHPKPMNTVKQMQECFKMEAPLINMVINESSKMAHMVYISLY